MWKRPVQTKLVLKSASAYDGKRKQSERLGRAAAAAAKKNKKFSSTYSIFGDSAETRALQEKIVCKKNVEYCTKIVLKIIRLQVT